MDQDTADRFNAGRRHNPAFADLFARALRLKGETAEQFARRCGADPAEVGTWLQGQVPLVRLDGQYIDQMLLLADLMDLRTPELTTLLYAPELLGGASDLEA